MKGRGISVTQVYANNNVSKQVSGINAAIAGGAKVIATSVPDASALKDPLAKAAAKGIVIITVNSGLGAFDDLSTYEVHVGQTEDIAGQGAGKQFKKPGAKKVLIVIHEASNSGLQQRADGVKKIMGSSAVKVLTIPNAKSDIPGTKAKVKAAFTADKVAGRFLGLDPDVTIPCTGRRQGRDEGRHVRRRRLDQADPVREDDVRDRPAAVPPGVPAGGVRDALRHQPEHGRQRCAGADRPRDHQQGERGPHRRARREGNPLGEPGGRLAARPMAEQAEPTPTRTSVSSGSARSPASSCGRTSARSWAQSRCGSRSRTSPAPSTGSAIPAIAAGWTDQAAQFGIVAVPVALLMIGGEFDLSAGAMIGSSGLLLGYLATFQDVNIWPAMAIVILFGLAIGFINGFVVIRTNLPSFIVTLATFFVLQGVNAALTLRLTGTTAIQNIDAASGFASARRFFASDLTQYDYKVKVLWWIGLTLVGAWLLAKSRFGNWIYAAGGDPVAARNIGVPVARTKIALFMMTSGTAALMGIITALELRSIQAKEGIGLEFIFIICAVVGGCLLTGGYGSVIGTFFGAAMLGMVQLGIIFAQWDSNWTFTFQGAILFAAVMLNTVIRNRAQRAR